MALFVPLDASYAQDPKILDLDDERSELLCGCHADCPMVCTFTSRHEGPCDWWLRRGGDQEQARGHTERKADR